MKKAQQPTEACSTSNNGRRQSRSLKWRGDEDRIIFHLSATVSPVSELRRADDIGTLRSVLIQQLRDLEKDGVVARKGVPGRCRPKGVQSGQRDGMLSESCS